MFRHQLEVDKNIEKAVVEGTKIYGEFKQAPVDMDARQRPDGSYPKYEKKFVTTLPPMALSDPSLDHQLREQLKRDYKASEPADNTFFLLLTYLLITVGLFAGLWVLFRKARDSFFTGGLTGGVCQERRPTLRRAATSRLRSPKWRASKALRMSCREVVEFLRNPAKFQRLGARVPKGILLMGPPGHRQDAPGTRRGRRGRCAVLFDQWLRVHSDVRRRGRRPRS